MQSMTMTLKKAQKGFTLIELLVVIGILAVLLAITLIAINPAKQFAQANNTKRRSDVNAILNAINQYMADNKGLLPAGIDSTTRFIGGAAGDANLCTVLVPTYIAALPVDPKTGNGNPIQESDCGTGYVTRYQVVQSGTSNRITVSAPDVELSDTIQVTR